MRRKGALLSSLVCLLTVVILSGCSGSKDSKAGRRRSLVLATTTSTQDSGLLDEIIPSFEKKYDVRVKTIAVGTGEALALGMRGEVDILLVHNKEAEDRFVSQGYGKDRKDVMYNRFVIVGPSSDPAKIKGEDAVTAFKMIAATRATFVSRGDDSGTDEKEKGIWRQAEISPSQKWYLEVGQGMGETLRIADERQAYTLSDQATYLAQEANINLEVLVDKGGILLNPYGVIAVSPTKFSEVNYKGAVRFVNWITSHETQKVIKDFGRKKYGQSLFIPNSDEWKAELKH